ncbi:MAG: radical SAM protein [Theionarchaea archaeon]|nr:radical SAM protein [Theionarchaea archaeon]
MDQEFYREEPPATIHLRLTEQCNLNCVYCLVDAKEFSAHVMQMEFIEKVLNMARQWGVSKVNLSGGEPLLHPDFSSILESAERNDLKIGIATNGLLLSKEVAAHLAEASVFSILLNIDGTKDIHDNLRGKPGAFESACHALDILETHGLIEKISIATILTAQNCRIVPAIIRIIEEYPVKEYRLTTLMPVGRGKTSRDKFSMKKEDWMVFIYGILPKILETRPKVKLSFPYMLLFQILKNVGFSDDTLDTVIEKIDLDSGVPVGCEGAEDVIIVSYKGDVHACPQLPQLAAGNLKDNSLQYFWNCEVFRDFRKNKFTYPETCLECSFAPACRGGCQAYKINSGNSLTEKDPRCALFEQIRREKK